MLYATLSALSGLFMKIGLAISAIKFKVALVTMNTKAVIAHYKFSEGMRIGMHAKHYIPI